MSILGKASPAKATIDGVARKLMRGPELSSTNQRYVSELELAARWGMSIKTLQRWRSIGSGPVFAKFGKAVRYPLHGSGAVLDMEAHATSTASGHDHE